MPLDWRSGHREDSGYFRPIQLQLTGRWGSGLFNFASLPLTPKLFQGRMIAQFRKRGELEFSDCSFRHPHYRGSLCLREKSKRTLATTGPDANARFLRLGTLCGAFTFSFHFQFVGDGLRGLAVSQSGGLPDLTPGI